MPPALLARAKCLPTRLATAVLALILTWPLALHAQQAALPSPESVFGYPVGKDSALFTYDESIGYFRRLAQASDRVRLLEVGKTSYGKPWTVVLISSPGNLAKLDRYREINQRLARPEGLTADQARALAREGVPLVDISGGLHASEIAGSQHTPQLAWELLSRADTPEMREILDNAILFLWPSINPDGQDIVVNWCRALFAGQSPAPMELYQKYVGHDNNRDSYMLNVVESRVVARTWRVWEPQIIYAHHQSSPFPTRIWLPPFADPIGLRAPAIMGRQVNTIGMRIASELDAKGQPGAVHMLATFDAWYPGYIDYMPMYQNIAAWWTETQGGNCGIPRTTTVNDLPAEYRALQPKSMYVSPWAEGTWRLRDQVDYMVTASVATLRYAAKFREELLFNRYLAGRTTIEQFRSGAPYAYLVPQAQRDPVAPVELLRRMAFLGVRVHQLDREVSYDGATYPSGTWVIPMDQEFAQLVRELFEVQVYPDLGDDLPYDAAGWTLPFQTGVHVVEAKAPLPLEFRAALRPVAGTADAWGASAEYPFATDSVAAGIVPAAPTLTGRGPVLALDPAQLNAFRLMNRAIAEGGAVRFAPASATGDARYFVSGVDQARLTSWANELWVSGERVSAAAARGAAPVPTRLALYKGAPGNMDQGWTEWLLDTYGFRYTLVGPAELRAGNLRERFDVILFASQGVTAGRGGGRGGPPPGAAGGGRAGGAPNAAVAQEDSARIRGVDEFVRAGGTAVFWNQGSTAAIAALQLPVRNVVAGLSRQEYFTGGSIMRVLADTTHPVMAGMPGEADVVVSGSPVFETLDGFEGAVLARYPAQGSPLRSGFLHGEQHMLGRPAALDVRRGRGHVILFAMQPQWRGQPLGTFRMVFNAALAVRGGG